MRIRGQSESRTRKKGRIEMNETKTERKDGLHIDDFGNKRWYKKGLLHRDNDEPAVIMADGSKGWFIKGKAHRRW